MNGRERVRTALAHEAPGAVPIDIGGTAVTGIHVSCVAALREHYGLEKRPVKVHEPYQMLGMVDEDLKQAIGIDVEGVPGRETLFGFHRSLRKPNRVSRPGTPSTSMPMACFRSSSTMPSIWYGSCTFTGRFSSP